MSIVQRNMSLTGEPPKNINTTQKIGTFIGLFGLAIVMLAGFNIDFPNKGLWLFVALVGLTLGIILFAWGAYANKTEGIKK